MKTKYILFVLLIGLTFPMLSKVQAAPYRSYFGKEFTHWYVVNNMIDVSRWSKVYAVYNQDTLLNNGIRYMKVYDFYPPTLIITLDYYLSGIREEIETGSLFIALNNIYGATDEVSEVLVSRMDLGIGDKYYFPPIRADFNQPYCWHCFQDVQRDEKGYFATVDSIYYKDNRKYIQFDVTYHAMEYIIPLTFIEGIGPNISFEPLFSEISEAICCNCYEDETGVWKSDIKNEYIDFSQVEDCFFELTGIPQIDSDIPLKIIQRRSEIELQPDAGSFESGWVYVYSVQGKTIYAKPVERNASITISTSGFPSGAYIIRLTDEKTKKSWSRKVVV